MQITASVPPQRVTARLDFSKPFEAHNMVDFRVQAQGDKSSVVTWAMHGQPLIAFNGGPHFKLNEAASLFVQRDDQAEVDKLWNGLRRRRRAQPVRLAEAPRRHVVADRAEGSHADDEQRRQRVKENGSKAFGCSTR